MLISLDNEINEKTGRSEGMQDLKGGYKTNDYEQKGLWYLS